MKTRTATLLSLAGVLAAGSAAALVNTQVLQGSGDALASNEAVEQSSTTAATVPVVLPLTAGALETANTTPTTASGPRRGSTTAPTTTVDPIAGDHIFQVGDSGVVTVTVAGGNLLLVDSVASPGWTVVSAAPIDPQRVLVVFRSSTVEVEFLAGLAFGQVLTDVSARELPQPGSTGGGTATPAPTAASSGGQGGEVESDDDEWEDDESEDHEDEDHESEDHEDEDQEDENDD